MDRARETEVVFAALPMQEGLRELSVELSLDSLPALSRRICTPRAFVN
jgi:hypothetical protein